MKDAPQRVQQFWQTIDCGVALEDESGSIQVDSPIGSLCSHPPAITPAIRFLRLNEAEWHGKIDSLGSIMLVRECYPRMWSLIKQRSKEGLRYFGILGEPTNVLHDHDSLS